MPRLFVPAEQINGQQVEITDEDAHYLVNVLRLGVGDSFEVVAPTAAEYTVVIEHTEAERVTGQIRKQRTRPTEPDLHLTLYQAVLKGNNFSLIVEKAVELGVSVIVPLLTRRTVVKLNKDRASQKQQCWQKIARQYTQQSERMELPTVKPAVSLSEALTAWQQSKTPGLVFSARTSRDKAHRLRQALARLGKTAELSLFIGPEGGFTAPEVESAANAGLDEVSLGARILRSETAAIVACTICMYELCELN